MFPIYDLIHSELIKREVIHADETTCQVLGEEGKEAQSTSYMWIYTSGTDGLPKIVLYEYQPGRGGIHPQEFLEGFHGLLQCDGYQGYNKVVDILLACCMAHCRRKFYEALPAEKKKTMKLLDINSPIAIKEPDIPVWDNFWKWIDSLNTTGGSKLSKVVNYAKNHRDSLCTMLFIAYRKLGIGTAMMV